MALGALSTAAQAFDFVFEGTFPTREYPFAVKDSGVEVRVDEDTVLEWIDADKVIFSALKPGEPRLQDALFHADRKSHEAPGRVVVWDTRTGDIKDLGEGKLHCAYRGYVSYYWEIPNPTTGKPEAFFKKGMYGSEVASRGWRPGDPPRHRDTFTCQGFDGPRQPEVTDCWVYQLRVADGVVATSRKGQAADPKAAAILMRPDGTRHTLDLPQREVQGAWWNDWAGVYLLAQLRSGGKVSPREDFLPILYPDGRIEQYRIPDSYSLRESTRLAVITRRGFVVTNDRVFTGAFMSNKSTSGAYLMREGQVVRLVPWLVGNERSFFDNTHRGMAVSADGCKLAFKHGEGDRYKVKHTIKMIDLCEPTP